MEHSAKGFHTEVALEKKRGPKQCLQSKGHEYTRNLENQNQTLHSIVVSTPGKTQHPNLPKARLLNNRFENTKGRSLQKEDFGSSLEHLTKTL